MFIITNCTQYGNYTPSVVETKEEAVEWMRECTKNNILAANDDIDENLSDDEIFKYAEDNMNFKIYENESKLYYPDGNYNIMQIFEFVSGNM